MSSSLPSISAPSDDAPKKSSHADLLSPDNLCGGTLLRIVARGSSILTELMRLSAHIPEVFVDSCLKEVGCGPPADKAAKSQEAKEGGGEGRSCNLGCALRVGETMESCEDDNVSYR
jgi:hypothetical protein